MKAQFNNETNKWTILDTKTMEDEYNNEVSVLVPIYETTELNLSKCGHDIDNNENLGEITWGGTLTSVLHESASIHVEASERWDTAKYGSDLYIKTTTAAAGASVNRIAIEGGNTKIQNGNLYVENNLYVTGTIDNLNNVGALSSKIITTSATSYTGSTTDYTIITTNAGIGNVTVVLPGSCNNGRIFNVKNMNGGGGTTTVVVTSGSGDTIVLASPAPALTTGDFVTVQYYASTKIWYVIGLYYTP
jgi:hypothetical protein